MEAFKIEFSDVRLTPEQLKVVQDKIESLEKDNELARVFLERTNFFLKKISHYIEMDPQEINAVLNSDKDFDVFIQNSPISDKVLLRFKMRPL